MQALRGAPTPKPHLMRADRPPIPAESLRPLTHRPDIQRVDVDSLELIRPRSVGVEHVGLWAMDQLGLRPCSRS